MAAPTGVTEKSYQHEGWNLLAVHIQPNGDRAYSLEYQTSGQKIRAHDSGEDGSVERVTDGPSLNEEIDDSAIVDPVKHLVLTQGDLFIQDILQEANQAFTSNRGLFNSRKNVVSNGVLIYSKLICALKKEGYDKQKGSGECRGGYAVTTVSVFDYNQDGQADSLRYKNNEAGLAISIAMGIDPNDFPLFSGGVREYLSFFDKFVAQ